ncbi:hypothetical protein [uncultured Microbacterium sp.]|uniref:hypothetical protein n=1 Tax=uncultured Microbacterium sp. TaxID=191216 RepID=UPI0025E32F9C|nr:hypothetical protein [uncultured Microbacterium sp.]
MRRVEAGPAPMELVNPGSDGALERAAVALFYADINRTKQFKFAAYKQAEVKTLLTEVFRSKCGYCEADLAAVSFGDIEHYRPKSAWIRTDGSKSPTGYYWLASEWNNLLLSCTLCNSRSKRLMADGTRVPAGKGNHFPLVNESARARTPGGEQNEEPLLLSPRDTDVEQHFVYSEGGVIRPADIQGHPSTRAEATIRILGLMREGLVRRRRDRLRALEGYSARYRREVQAMEQNPNDTGAEVRIAEVMSDFVDSLRCRQEFITMCRQYIATNHPELSGQEPCSTACICDP